jgi:hypothetical protein
VNLFAASIIELVILVILSSFLEDGKLRENFIIRSRFPLCPRQKFLLSDNQLRQKYQFQKVYPEACFKLHHPYITFAEIMCGKTVLFEIVITLNEFHAQAHLKMLV